MHSAPMPSCWNWHSACLSARGSGGDERLVPSYSTISSTRPWLLCSYDHQPGLGNTNTWALMDRPNNHPSERSSLAMSGAIRSQCCACGALFVSIAAFDYHRVGPYSSGGRRCLAFAEMLAKGMIQDTQGCWHFNPEQPCPGVASLSTHITRRNNLVTCQPAPEY